MLRIVPVVLLCLCACATGPTRRATLVEALETSEANSAEHAMSAASTPVERLALPVTVGALVGVAVELDHGRPSAVAPVEVLAAGLAIARPGVRTLGVEFYGGLSGPGGDVRSAWGLGLSYELGGGAAYEVGISAGALWSTGQADPAALVGLMLRPKL